MFAKDTLEDPANRFERDGFLDEIERISDGTGVFDSAKFEALDVVPRGAGTIGGPRTRVRRARGCCRRPERRRRGRVRAAGIHEPSRHGSRADRGASATRAATTQAHRRGTSTIWSSRSRTSRSSSLPRFRRSGCRRVKWRSRSHVSATRGASAAPDAVRRHASCSSVGRCWTRPCIAAAAERGTYAAGGRIRTCRFGK